MIRVIDTLTNRAIKIEVCGIPRQWRLMFGESGVRKIKRGRCAGQERTGVIYNPTTTTYHGNLREVMQTIQTHFAKEFSLAERDVTIEGMAGWEKAVAEEQKLLDICQKVETEFGKFFNENAEALRKMSSANGALKGDEEELAEEEDVVEETEEAEEKEEKEEKEE